MFSPPLQEIWGSAVFQIMQDGDHRVMEVVRPGLYSPSMLPNGKNGRLGYHPPNRYYPLSVAPRLHTLIWRCLAMPPKTEFFPCSRRARKALQIHLGMLPPVSSFALPSSFEEQLLNFTKTAAVMSA